LGLYFYAHVRYNLLYMGIKISFERKQIFAESRGYKLISDSGPDNKITLLCTKHGEFKASWSNFRHRNSGCPSCKAAKAALQKIPYNTLVDLAAKNHFLVHTTKEEYEKSHSKKMKIDVTCQCGHRHKKTSFQLRNSTGCIKCRYRNGHPNQLSYDAYLKKAKELGYTIKDNQNIKNTKTKFVAICSKHGEFETTYNSLDQGHKCYRCSSFGSKGEIELSLFIESLGLQIEKNNRTILDGQELDIYIPSKKIAIEYCGLYWHSEEKKGKNYHKDKHDLCAKNGIQLITIFEDEWFERKNQIKTILKAKLNLLPKIYARKTKTVFLDKRTAIDFLNQHHLQSACNFLIALGLEFEGEIVACATISKHHRPSRSEAVLSRVCFADKAVVGGTGKLLKQIIIESRKLGFDYLVSWSDNRWSKGNVYRELGMTPEKLGPDYSYFKLGNPVRLSKQSCQKKYLLKKGAIGNTESEMAKSLGYSKIWDCGKVKWSLKL